MVSLNHPKLTTLALAASTLVPASVFALDNYTSGHGDIAVEYEEGTGVFELVFLFGEGGEAYTINGVPDTVEQEVDLDTVSIIVPLTSTSPVKDSGLIDTTPTGAAAGESVFIIPQGFTGGVPFLGFDIEGILGGHGHGGGTTPPQTAADNEWTGPLTFTLDDVRGPGAFALFNNATPGPDFFMTSADGIDGTDSFSADPDVENEHHQHFNITFTEEGTYEVDITVSGLHEEDGAVSGSGTLLFQVVPEPSTYALLAGVFVLVPVLLRRKLSSRKVAERS